MVGSGQIQTRSCESLGLINSYAKALQSQKFFAKLYEITDITFLKFLGVSSANIKPSCFQQYEHFVAVSKGKRVNTKHLMTGPKGNIKFCFPETLNVEVEGKQNSLFPAKPVIKCFVIPPN